MDVKSYPFGEWMVNLASWTPSNFGRYPKSPKWSSQSRPMTDFVRKSRLVKPHHASLFLSLCFVNAAQRLRENCTRTSTDRLNQADENPETPLWAARRPLQRAFVCVLINWLVSKCWSNTLFPLKGKIRNAHEFLWIVSCSDFRKNGPDEWKKGLEGLIGSVAPLIAI